MLYVHARQKHAPLHTGRPAMMSLMSASASVPLQLRMASAATRAASRPKLFVLNLICDGQHGGSASLGASTHATEPAVCVAQPALKGVCCALAEARLEEGCG